MRCRQVVAVVAPLLASGIAAADEATIEDFSGYWQGLELHAGGDGKGLALTPDNLDVRIRPEDGGFHMSWIGLARAADGELKLAPSEASFTPTERPGVFAFDAGESSLLGSLFADPATGNPLQGETLLWARLAGDTLTVYSLAIDFHGGFDLDRYARSLTDEGMTAHYTRRSANDVIMTIAGRLEPAGE